MWWIHCTSASPLFLRSGTLGWPRHPGTPTPSCLKEMSCLHLAIKADENDSTNCSCRTGRRADQRTPATRESRSSYLRAWVAGSGDLYLFIFIMKRPTYEMRYISSLAGRVSFLDGEGRQLVEAGSFLFVPAGH